MSHIGQVLAIWASGTTCYAAHKARATYIVHGDDETLAACGDHVSRAIREICQQHKLSNVTVWCKP